MFGGTPGPPPQQTFDFYVAPAAMGGSNNNNGRFPTSQGGTDGPFLTLNHAVDFLTPGTSLGVRGVGGGTNYVESLTGIPSGTSVSSKVRIANYNGETVWIAPPSGTTAAVVMAGNEQYIEFDGINMRSPGSPERVFSLGPGGISTTFTIHHIYVKNAELVSPGGPSNWSGLVFCHANDCEFTNLVVHGQGNGYGFYIRGSRNIIDGCDVYDTVQRAISIHNNSGNPTDNVVRNCRLHGIRVSTVVGGSSPDTRIFVLNLTGTNTLAYNNLIYDSGLSGGHSDNCGINLSSYSGGANLRVYNNTIYGLSPSMTGIKLTSFQPATDAEVINNISYGNASGNFSDAGISTRVETNSWQAPVNGANPVFVAPTSPTWNFHLQSGSPCKDAGQSLAAIFTTDADGTTRPTPTGWSQGAYEA